MEQLNGHVTCLFSDQNALTKEIYIKMKLKIATQQNKSNLSQSMPCDMCCLVCVFVLMFFSSFSNVQILYFYYSQETNFVDKFFTHMQFVYSLFRYFQSFSNIFKNKVHCYVMIFGYKSLELCFEF